MEVAFKKKPKKAGPARKRSRRADAEEEQEQEKEKQDTLRVIEEVLEDQRLRAQVLKQELASRAASDAAAASAPSSKSSSKPAAESGEYGLHDPKKDGSAGQKLLSLLDGQFTGQSSTTQKDQHEELLYVSGGVCTIGWLASRVYSLLHLCVIGRSTLRRSCTRSEWETTTRRSRRP